ncbi:hypothetical protein BS47DRAFT_787748 [Hydnum rufescens UP504]|uniref:Uncharacterized protein n=1 Tax=Hydnum rufescens UP504 TaxID=1448309 RepID=A0A9P6B0J2_9AGAM|nr:hypothetical protein BS47DRAFT_787748 [Hydnum rufescens UP504]
MTHPSPQLLADSAFTNSPIQDVSLAAGWEEIPATQRTASPEELSPPVPSKSPSPWKGKGRATFHVDDTIDEEDLQSPVHPEHSIRRPPSADPLQETFETEQSIRYPPAADEVIEERRVVENLRRWEEIEKERRRVARESQTTNIPPQDASAVRTNVTRRGSLFWNGGSSGSRYRRPAPGSHPLHNDGETSRRTGLDDEEEDEDEEPKIPLSRVRHKARGSQDSHVSDSSVSTVTPHSHTPLAPGSGGSPKSQHSTANPFTDRAAENPFRDQPLEKERSAPSTGRPLRYPTPKPLGLPLSGRRPPSPVRDMQNTRSSSDSLPPGGKTLDEEAETGRWWTDWLCGCREGPDRGGDHQVRPLPFKAVPRVEYLSGWENKPFRVNRTGLRSRTPFHSFRRGHDFPFIAC